MTRWTNRHPIIMLSGVILLLALGVFAIWKSNFENYCFAQKRFLQEQEVFEIVIRDAFWSVMSGKKDFSKSDISSNSDEARIQIDNLIAEFLQANQNCCRVMADGDKFISEGWFRLGLLGILTGRQSYIVEVKYDGFRQNSGLFEVSAPRHIYRTVGACGNIYRYF